MVQATDICTARKKLGLSQEQLEPEDNAIPMEELEGEEVDESTIIAGAFTLHP